MSLGKRKINSKASKNRVPKQDKPVLLKIDKCDPEIYEHGRSIAVIHSIDSEIIELIVRLAARNSKQKIDWFYMGGRAVVRVLGDPFKALDHFQKFLHLFKRSYYRIHLETFCPACQGLLEYDDDLSEYLFCQNESCLHFNHMCTREKWQEIEERKSTKNLKN